MKAPKSVLASILAVAVVSALVPASAGAAAYRHYVACGLEAKAKPAHACPRGAKKGAFFKSTRRDVHYTICMRLPSGRSLCAKRQEANQGTLYVNKITSTVPGRHRVTWFVEGKRVGVSVFRVTGGR